MGAEIVPMGTETGCLALIKEKEIKVSKLHGELGQAREEKVHATVKMMKLHVTRNYC